MKTEKFMEWTQLIHCPKLSTDEKVLLAIILDYNNLKIEGIWNNTPQKQLIQESQRAKNTVKGYISSLQSKGLIIEELDVYGSANDYIPIISNIRMLIEGSNNEPVNKGKVQNQNQGKVKNSPKVRSEYAPNTNTNNTNTKNANMREQEIDLSGSTSKPTIEVNETRSVNTEYIDRLEQQFNHIPNEQESTYPISGQITTEQVEALDVTSLKKNTVIGILNTIVEASENEYTLIAAMNKSNEFLQVWRQPNQYICSVYHNAHNLIKEQGNRFSEKKHKYAADTLQSLRNNIITCGGREMLNECYDVY